MTGHLVEPDRRAAIALALGLARPGDLVLVAGKGHEDYQIVGTVKRHLDDREEVRRALGTLGRASPPRQLRRRSPCRRSSPPPAAISFGWAPAPAPPGSRPTAASGCRS